MKIFIVEKESNTGGGFWINDCIIPCMNKEAAKREMKKMIEESSEGEFKFLSLLNGNKVVAISKNGWVRISFYKITVMK